MTRLALGLMAGLLIGAAASAQELEFEQLEAPEGAGPAYQDYQTAPQDDQVQPYEPADNGVTGNAPDEMDLPEEMEPASDTSTPGVEEEGSELDALAEPIPSIPDDTAPPPVRADDFSDQQSVSAPEGTIVTLRGLDKVTGRISEFDVTLNQPTQFGTVLIDLKYCEKAPPEETPEVKAFLQIFNQTASQSGDLEALDDSVFEEPEAVFSGWMFASSPAVSAMEHPIYDVWVIDCKRPAPSISADSR